MDDFRLERFITIALTSAAAGKPFCLGTVAAINARLVYEVTGV